MEEGRKWKKEGRTLVPCAAHRVVPAPAGGRSSKVPYIREGRKEGWKEEIQKKEGIKMKEGRNMKEGRK